MKRNLFAGLVVTLVTSLFSLVGMPSANASETSSAPQPVMHLHFQAAEAASLELESTTTLNTDAEGRTIVGPIRNVEQTYRNARHWVTSDAVKCPTVANQPRTDAALKAVPRTSFVRKGAALKRFKRAAPTARVTKHFPDGRQKLTVRCYWVAVGGTFTDTGEDPNGELHGILNTVERVPMLFDTHKTGVIENGETMTREVSVRRGQDFDGDGIIDDGDCRNPKADEVDLHPGEFVYVMTWDKVRQRVQGALHQRLHVSGTGSVSQGGCEVHVNYDMDMTGRLAFDQIFWAKTKAEAEGMAHASVSTDISSNTEVTGSLEQELSFDLQVTFNDQCDNPPSDEDHAPQISCVNPAHVYEGGNVYMWCEASDPDSDALSVNVVGDQYAHVSGVIPSDVRWDGSPCPSNTSCYRATLWGDKVGTAHIVATVTANGKQGTWSADVPVKPDDFGAHQGHYTPEAYVVNGRVVNMQ